MKRTANDFRPGTYSASDTRYSFFRILYRDIDSTSPDFNASTNLYGVRSATGVDVYNYLRFKFGASKRREFRFMPVSSWEIRAAKLGKPISTPLMPDNQRA